MSGTLSPDGKWLWNGTEWVPAPPVVSAKVVQESAPLVEAAAKQHGLNVGDLQKQTQNFDLDQNNQISQAEVNLAAQSMVRPPTSGYPNSMMKSIPQENSNKVMIAITISVAVILIGSVTAYFLASDVAENAPAPVLDRDYDGIYDVDDTFPDNPTQWKDTDGDGWGDNQSAGATQVDDFPTNPTQYRDSDGDGWGDNQSVNATQIDAFPTTPSEWFDFDGDGIGDNGDSDDDGDGMADVDDAFPYDSTEDTDTDEDGIGNNADTDDDADGTADLSDAFPLNPSEDTDTDGDGIGNNADTDDDGDGVADASDVFPLDSTEDTDTDGDGIGNNADTDDDADGTRSQRCPSQSL